MKRKLAQNFTPESLAKFTLEEIGFQGEGKIIDNSCGNGAFLVEIAKTIQEKGENFADLYGWDIDPEVIEESKKRLNEITVFDWQVRQVQDSVAELFLKKAEYSEFFDFVIGNPPYISYNESSSRGTLFFQFLKEGKVKLNDVYGVNLHSIPNFPKGYRPNPNLYAFFVALGLGLLKAEGKMGYIIPQTLLTAGDLDVLRYHLAKYTTIEKIILVDSQLFTDRGLKQNYTVATSNLIFVVKKQMPDSDSQVEILYHPETERPIDLCMQDLQDRNYAQIKRFLVPQSELLENAKNWNFLKTDLETQHFYKKYCQNSEGMEKYYQHDLAANWTKARFYFDGGYMVMEKEALAEPQEGILCYEIAKIDEKRILLGENKRYVPNQRIGNEALTIKLRQASQGYTLLDSPYKIVWSTRNPKQFHFTDRPIIWANNRLGGIGSADRTELLFLFALLNSSTNRLIINLFLKTQGEKDLLLQINFVKEFLRVPRITPENEPLKRKIIELTEELLALETVKLADLVDFSKVMIQKFDSFEIEKASLILKSGDQVTKCRIKKEIPFLKEMEFLKKTENLTLKALKNQTVIDETRQAELKKEIDVLVEKMYFG